MSSQMEIIVLLSKKQAFELELHNFAYGSIEIRENDNKKYIYVHYKDDGVPTTKYVGEYSLELYNLILNNNFKAKEIKKEIRKIDKKLRELKYVDQDLDENVIANIDYARRHLAETIYKQAILEGVATTLSDTKNIIEGGIINNMSSSDILKVINLKHAWEFILNKIVILSPSDYAVLCTINKLVEEGFYYNAGFLRSVPVKIGGTYWTPEIPYEKDIRDDIYNIVYNDDKDDIDRAIDLLLYVVKKQMFIDGNKRTSVIFANHYLISHGKGLIVIPDELVEEYKDLLIKYYESDDSSEIRSFIREKCYQKIDIN